MFLCKSFLILLICINFGYMTQAVKTDKKGKTTRSSSPKSAIKYHGSGDTAGSYKVARLIAQESRPNGKRQSYSYAATQRPVSYSQSYDSGPIYYESNNPPQSYYREYRSPPSSYNVDYNERPSGNSYHSPPQRSQRRNSYNNQDSGEHRDADQHSYGSDDNDYNDNDGGYGDNDSNHNEGDYIDNDSHDANDSHGGADDDYGHSESQDSPSNDSKSKSNYGRQVDGERGFRNLDY